MRTKKAHKLVGMVGVVVAAFCVGFAVDAAVDDTPAGSAVRVPAMRAGASHDVLDIFYLSPEQFVNAMSGVE